MKNNCANCPVKRNVAAMIKSEKGILIRCQKTFHVDVEEVTARNKHDILNVVYAMFPGK